jgi:hypothetical protein
MCLQARWQWVANCRLRTFFGFPFLERRTVNMCFVSKDKAAKQIAASRPGALTLRRLSEIAPTDNALRMPFGDNFTIAVRDLAAG